MSTPTAPGATKREQCGIPGCVNMVEYVPGTGRPPRYCGRAVDGVTHNRYLAWRINHGMSAAATDPDAAGQHSDRPVSLARAELEVLAGDLAERLAAYQAEFAELVEKFAAAAGVVSDPAAAAAEVTAAHRDAQVLIAAAEADRDNAAAVARQAQANTEAARNAQTEAETAAEEALNRLDIVAADNAGISAENAQLRELHTELEAQLAQARAEVADLTGEREELADRLRGITGELATARTDCDILTDRLTERDHELAAEQRAHHEQERRAALAEERADRAESMAANLTAQLDSSRVEIRTLGERVGDLRADLAGAAATATGLREQLKTARIDAQQRLEDATARHAEQLSELRERHAAARSELAELRARLGLDGESDPPAGAPAAE